MVKNKVLGWFMGFFGLYFIVRYIRANWLEAPSFIQYYFTDLLFVPTMCLFALFFVRLLKRDQTLKISPALILIQVVLVSVYFEWYLPNYQNHVHPYTSDTLDIVMYIIGGIIFWRLQKIIS
ncbi:MAG: hypothetical protein ACSHXL_06265 [Bacteroidota bacterium]